MSMFGAVVNDVLLVLRMIFVAFMMLFVFVIMMVLIVFFRNSIGGSCNVGRKNSQARAHRCFWVRTLLRLLAFVGILIIIIVFVDIWFLFIFIIIISSIDVN